MEAPGSPYASSPESAPKRGPRSSLPPPQDRPDADHDAAEPQDDKEKPTHLRFLVSNTAAGCIIGKGGSTINDFQSQSGARIQLSRSHEFFPGTNDRIIMVSGLFDEVVKAMELVLEKLLSEGEESNEAEARPKFRLVVPNSSCGGIIGKGGATIKSFIEDSHAGIKISPQDNNFVGLHDRLVTITGPLNSQMRAIFLILSKLSEDVHYPPNLSSPFPYAGLGFLRPSHGDDDKNNVAKKQYHHHTGSGGYLKVRPLWDKAENDLIAKGVEPETLNWPGRLRTWFFGVGGTLDPKTGKCRWTDEQLAIPVKKLQKYITAAQEETFIPDREKDELTEALRNPEHPGRTRGTPGSVPWKVGFPDAGGYRSRERKRKAELSDMQKVNARLEKLEELVSQRSAGQPGTPGSVPWKVGFPDAGGYRSRERKRKAELSDMQKLNARLEKLEEQFESQRAIGQPSQRHEATPEATPPSQRRSSVASTEFVQSDFTAPSYPVDTITEAQPCELMMKCRNLTLKAAVGSVVPPQPNETFHCLLIPHDYAVVTVDEVIEGFEELELDYPTGEGENQLVHVLRSTCLWRKENINLPNWTPSPPPPPPASQGTPPPQQTQAESSPVRQPSPPSQGTPTEEAPQQKPPPPQLSPPRHRTLPPPLKRVAAAPAASSSTKQRRFRYG